MALEIEHTRNGFPVLSAAARRTAEWTVASYRLRGRRQVTDLQLVNLAVPIGRRARYGDDEAKESDMTNPEGDRTAKHAPEAGEVGVPEIESDETVAPRPEEAIADALRAEPDTTDHGHAAADD